MSVIALQNLHIYSCNILVFLLASGKGQAVFYFAFILSKKKTMAKAAKTPQDSLIDFLEDLDSYICSLGHSNLVHIQTFALRFIAQNKRKYRLTDEYVQQFTTGISTIIDILVAIDKKSKSLNIS